MVGTWRRTIEAEMEEAGKNWGELGWLAQDRPGWRSFVDAFMLPWGRRGLSELSENRSYLRDHCLCDLILEGVTIVS